MQNVALKGLFLYTFFFIKTNLSSGKQKLLLYNMKAKESYPKLTPMGSVGKRSPLGSKRFLQESSDSQRKFWFQLTTLGSYLQYVLPFSGWLFYIIDISASSLKKTLKTDKRKCTSYSQTRIKCSRLLCSLPGLQGQKPMSRYYFTFWNSTISVFMKFLWDQPVLSYSTHGSQKSAANQKNREKTNFQTQFWSTSDQ